MSRSLAAGVLFISLIFSLALRAEEPSARLLSVLTYDSFMAPGGLGLEIISRFEKTCRCKVRVQVLGDAVQMISQLRLDHVRQKRRSQVVIGVDQILWHQIKPMALAWTPDQRFVHKVDLGFTPFDYGVLSLIINPAWKGFKTSEPLEPQNWSDLLDPQWRRAILLQDPRTSSPGLGFLLGAKEALGSEFLDFSNKLKAQWLTLSAGWSGAYRLFLKGEAPLVWSYTTSQAYHRMRDPQSRYRAVIFEDGNPIQIEGVVILKESLTNSSSSLLAKEFVSFLVSKEIQELIPTHQWMFPSVFGVSLPKEFKDLPQPKRSFLMSEEVSIKEVLKSWEMSIR